MRPRPHSRAHTAPRAPSTHRSPPTHAHTGDVLYNAFRKAEYGADDAALAGLRTLPRLLAAGMRDALEGWVRAHAALLPLPEKVGGAAGDAEDGAASDAEGDDATP